MLGLGLERFLPLALYLAALAAIVLSLAWRPAVGLYYLILLIPLQTLRYRLAPFPLGESVVGIILLAVLAGLLFRGQLRAPRPWLSRPLALYSLFTFASLFWGVRFLGPAFPFAPRLGDWLDYMLMPILLLAACSALQSPSQLRLALLLMAAAALLLNISIWNRLSERDLSTYSDGLAVTGAMGYAGVNGLAAFQAQFAALLLAAASRLRHLPLKSACWALAAFTLLCLMYSFSRGGYAAFLAACFLLALLAQRTLLIPLAILLFAWPTLVPTAVKARVEMTYQPSYGALDSSSETRLLLWSDALALARYQPILGTGFQTYAYMDRVGMSQGGAYADTHNYFVKVLLETGLAGLALFLWLLWRMARTGYSLFRLAPDPLLQALGLGLTVWVAASAAANLFGDRWSFLQVNGYLWILAGMASRAHALIPPPSPEPTHAAPSL